MTKYDPTEEMQRMIDKYGVKNVKWQVALAAAEGFNDMTHKEIAGFLIDGQQPIGDTPLDLLDALGICPDDLTEEISYDLKAELQWVDETLSCIEAELSEQPVEA